MNDEPMDDETREAFAKMMKLINDGNERVIDRLTTLEGHVRNLSRDFQTTKGFLIEDALTLGRRIANVENRLDDLDRKEP